MIYKWQRHQAQRLYKKLSKINKHKLITTILRILFVVKYKQNRVGQLIKYTSREIWCLKRLTHFLLIITFKRMIIAVL